MTKSAIVKPGSRGSFTIPKEFRAGWDRPDFILEVVLRDDGVIELRPRLAIDPAQSWFWTERWQQMEREADEAIASGQSRVFDDAASFLAALEE